MKNLKLMMFIWLCCTKGIWAQTITINNGCNSEGNEIWSGLSFATSEPSDKALMMLGHVMEVAGVKQNFELKCANVENVFAATESGRRYVFYSNSFLKKLDRSSTFWGAYFLLAHEFGHHLKQHDFDETDPYRIKYNELEADIFAGSALRALGATLEEAEKAVKSLPMLNRTETRPLKSSRLEAMILGWKRHDRKIGPEESGYLDYPVATTFHQLVDSSSTNFAPQKKPTVKKGKAIVYDDTPEVYDFNEDPKDYFETSTYLAQDKYSKMPDFPWPPPNCYQHKTLVKNLRTKAEYFYDVDNRLQHALDDEGYYQRSYYQTPGGFAIATQMEQFEDDGSVKKRYRWKNYPVQDDFNDVWAYFKSLVMPTPGRFRVFVFVVTDRPYPQSTKKITPDGIQGLAAGGYNQMPVGYSGTEITNAHYLEVLIYEFEAPQSTKRCMEKCPAFLDVQMHLSQSGLSDIIGF